MITAVQAVISCHTTHQNLCQKIAPNTLEASVASGPVPPNLRNPSDAMPLQISMDFPFFLFVPHVAQVCVVT